MAGTRLMPDSMTGRTVLAVIAALALSLVAAVALFAGSRLEAMEDLLARQVSERLAPAVSAVAEAPPDARPQRADALSRPGLRLRWTPAPVVGPEGDGRLAGLAAAVAERLDIAEARIRRGAPPSMGLRRDLPHHGGPHRHWRMMGGEPVILSLRMEDGWLNVATFLEPVAPVWQSRFPLGLAVVVLVVAGVAVLAVRGATRPLATFAGAAERLGADLSAPPLPEQGPREVRRAARAFNVMQKRLRRFVEDRTQMLAAVSHDLRTPITRMRLRAEFVEDDEQRAKMLGDLDEMEAMIAAALSFARDDAAREARRRVDLAAMLASLAGEMGASYEGPATLSVAVAPMALKRAVANLVDNAGKYGGGAVTVRLREDGADIVVEIEDNGPGIAEEELERVFTPFYRLEKSRSRETGGTGLGLALARSAARAHGGDVMLFNRPEGGLKATMRIPVGTI